MSHNISITVTPSPANAEGAAIAREVTISILDHLNTTPPLNNNSYKVRTGGSLNIAMEDNAAETASTEEVQFPAVPLTFDAILDAIENGAVTDDVIQLLKLYRTENVREYVAHEKGEIEATDFTASVNAIAGTYEGSFHICHIVLNGKAYYTFDKELFEAAAMTTEEIAAATDKVGDVTPIMRARARHLSFKKLGMGMSSF